MRDLQVTCSTEFEKQFENFLRNMVAEENGEEQSSAMANIMIR